ncbi:SdrD B-like domain-containing protein [Mollicutes bacterium LVI A0078]|nr:SdrD B-like domain-containing protein [Mollicutes bacterium LVI A0075]WOO90770.1 SdrD B-like domain-containing protein [Mollicutes bacterium LVI A0078]
MKKSKVISMLMLLIILGQLWMPVITSASEIVSSIESTSEVTSDLASEVTSEVNEVDSDTSEVENEEVESETSSDIEVESESSIDSPSSELEINTNKTSRTSDSSITLVETNTDEVYSGDSITNRVEVSINPTDTGSLLNSNEYWSSFTITLDPEFELNETFGIEITQSTPEIISGYTVNTLSDGSTEINFELDQAAILAGGQTIGIIFVTEINSGFDLSEYGINVEMCGNQGTCYSQGTEVLYHDPAVMNITKEMIDPKYAAADEEVTYQITMSADGTGDIVTTPIPQIVDILPDNSTYVSSSPEGIYDGTSVTWDWTEEEIASRTKTVEITIIPDGDFYELGDTLTNTADAMYEGEEVASAEDKQDIYPGFFLELPDGGVSKNGAPTTNPDGSSTAPGDSIFWHFDNINYQGNGTLTNYTITDKFPVTDDGNDILLVDKVCYGAVKESPNAFVDATINYTDGSSEILTATMDVDGDNCISIPDEADIARDGVDNIVWNYGTVHLPFKITGAGVSTTLSDYATPETKIVNDLNANFTIPAGEGGEGEWDICPPPYISYENEDGSIECRDEVSDQVNVSNDEVYGIFTKNIIDTTSPLDSLTYGDTITYRLKIGNAKASPGNLLVDGVYDTLPEGLEYVEGSSIVSSSLPDSAAEYYDTNTNILSFIFNEDDQPLEIAPGTEYYIDFQAKVTSQNIEKLVNNAYLVSATPELLLNGTGTTSTTEPIDFDQDGTFEKVYNGKAQIVVNKAKVTVKKSITNKSKIFVPSNIIGAEGKSTVNYSFTITNESTKLFGTNYAPVIDPTLIDSMDKEVTLDESSIIFDYSDAPSMNDGGEVVTITGDGTSSPINGEGQTLEVDLSGTLNPGDSVTVTYSAEVKDYAIAAQIKNKVVLDVPKDEEYLYTDDSKFSAEAIGVIDEVAAQKITKAVDKTEAEPGESIAYEIEVSNAGTMPLKNVTFDDAIPHMGEDGTTTNGILSQLPQVIYTKRGGTPVERLVDFEVTYLTSDGSKVSEVITKGDLEEHIVNNDVENVIGLKAILPDTLYPGDIAELKFSVETKSIGSNQAIAGDELHNTAYFTSTAIKMDGTNGKNLKNGSNKVITTITDHKEGKYSIGDFVYFDLNNDGMYCQSPITPILSCDSTLDKPAKGAIMNLYDADTNELIASTTVDSEGYYQFTGLDEGNYIVEKESGYFNKWYQVYPQGSTELSLTQNITITDDDNLDADFRIVPASIIGTVYYDGYDENTSDDVYYNSIYDYTDNHESPLVTYDSNVAESEIKLYDSSNNLISTTTTENGMYGFYDLKAGTYTVESTPTITADDGQEYLLTNEKNTYSFTLDRGELRTDVDFGYIEPVELNGTVWYDTNVNNIFDSGENTDDKYTENRNLKVDLLDSNLKVIDSTTTNSLNGTYKFEHLLPANYSIKVTYSTKTPNAIHGLENITNSEFTESSDGKSATLTEFVKANTPGTVYSDNNLGIYQNAYISGKIYEDMNYNGVLDDSNPAENRTVELLDELGNRVSVTKTNASGNYTFKEVDPRLTYQIKMSSDNINDMFIDHSLTSDTVINSAGFYDNDGSSEFTLVPNEQLKKIDGSLYRYANIDGLAFIDMDGNGQQDFDNLDTYIEGLEVKLTGLDGLGNNVDITETTNDGERVYFDDLNPGNYTVSYSIPNNYNVTWKDKGNDATDSDVDRETADLSFNMLSDDHKQVDVGMYEPVSIGGYVFTDMDRDGYLNVDEDVPSSNKQVEIYYDGKLSTTVITDSNGYFELTGVEPGTYNTKVTLPNSSYEYTISAANETGKIASEVNTDGTTNGQLILSGEDNYQDFDSGYNERTSISGKIYLDTNADLKWDNSELLIDGITITLLDDTGSEVANTVTDKNGYYEFTNIQAGDYTVEADTVNYAYYENEDEEPSIQSNAKTPKFTAYSNTPVENVDGALTIAGDTTHFLISDYVWEDLNYDGIQSSGETPISGAKVTLLDNSGSELTYSDSYSGLGINSGDPVTTTTDSNGNYLLIVEGAGDYQVKIEAADKYYLTSLNAGSNTALDNDFSPIDNNTHIGYLEYTVDRDTRDIDAGVSDKGNISGYVYNDQDGDFTFTSDVDNRISNSQVALYDATGTTLLDVYTTGSDGYYEFTDLEAGEYRVKFENLKPKDAYWLHEADGTLYLDDSGNEAHRQIELAYGEDLTMQNAGQNDQSVLSGIVYEDVIADGVYDNSEDILLPNVTVRLMNADGTPAKDQTNKPLVTTTNSNGYYYFINMIPGDYYVVFDAPAGYTSSNIIPIDAETTANNDALLEAETIKTSNISIEENNGYLTLSDAALYIPVIISGYFYDDYDIDGKYTTGLDKPIEAGTVNLYDLDGNIVMSKETDSSGYYEFSDVIPNDYYVGFDTSSYDVISILGDSDTSYDNDLKQDSTTDSIRYESGNEYTVENDAAVYNLADISGYIYEDMNNDGYYQNGDEIGISTTVSLYNDEGYVDSKETNTDGSYSFIDLTPDNYYVTVENPGNEYYNAKLGDNSSGIANELTDTLVFDTQTIYSGYDDTINFDGGFYQLTDIEGQVFFDSDTNYTLNDSEFGIPNIGITLYSEDDLTTAVAITQTDSLGNYQFNDLVPGNYVVTSSSTMFGDYEDMPADYQIKSDMSTPVFTAYSDTLRNNVDGAVTQGTDVYLIGDYVWEDTNYNGLQDEEEPAYSGMKVELLDSTDSVVDSYTTDTDGLYYFFAPKGDYTLSFTAEDNYHFTKEVLLNNANDSNVPETTSNQSKTAITVDSNDLSYDAGVRKDANINGRVYYDTDASGTWDQAVDQSTEERTVSLLEGGSIVDQKVINLAADGTQGTYNFTDLEPGDYTIEFSDESNKFWVQNSDGLLVFDNTSEGSASRTVTLEYGETLNDQDAGYSTGASIAGFIYEDNDYDGTFSKYLPTPTTDDIAIEGATVNLVDSTNTVIDTTTTDSNGFYSFGNLEPYKSYATEIENKDDNNDGIKDYTVTSLGSKSTKYDNDMTTGIEIGTEKHTLGDNVYNDYDYDGGLLEYTNLSGYVYEDMEVNSTMDATDIGLNHIRAHLYDKNDNLIASTSTDSTGYYEFTNIYPGYYYVEFELEGYEVSPKGVAGVALENDIDDTYKTDVIDVRSRNDDDINFDAAVYTLVSVGGNVFIDGNADGLFDTTAESGLGNITVNLYNDEDELIDTTTSNADGSFEFTGLLPDEYYTMVDNKDYLISPLKTGTGITNDLNQDSTTDTQYVPSSTTNYDDYDAGLYELTELSGKIYLDTNADLTRQDSEWLIPDLTVTLNDKSGTQVATTITDENGYYEFTDLTPGDYEVIAETTAYATYENEDEVPSIQSDASTGVFTALSATPVVNVDGALTIAGDDHHFIISDYVWEDTNYDGIQDDSEPAMAGVKVRLLDSSGNQLKYTRDYPGLGISSGDNIETTTDSNGNYMLIAENEGNFIVETEAGSDYFITGTDATTDDLDNDFTGVTNSTNIGQYEYYADRDTTDVDSGYSEVGTIAGNVYDDEDYNFTYEAGVDIDVEGLDVELYLASDESTPIMTTTTNSSGYYEFKDLEANDYVVKFQSLADLEGFYVPEADGSLILDNNGYQAHRNVTLAYGEDKLHENAGKSETIILTGITFEDMIADGIYNPEEDILIPGVEVELLDETGNIAIDGIGEDLIRTTNDAGQYIMYHFLPNDYQVRFTTPVGYVETNVVPSDAKDTKNNDASINGAEYLTDLFTLEEHALYSTYGDASYYKPVTIEGDYYEDKNTNGKYDDGLDTLLSGYAVNLIDEAGDVAATTTTDGNGHYIFTDVVPGYYQVEFDTSDYDAISILGTEDTSLDNDLNSDGMTKQGRYTSGNTYSIENDGAVYNYVKISGYIYEDGNNDGYMADTENGLRAKVTLHDMEGNSQSLYSNHNGYYEFTELMPGKYYVTVEAPDSTYHAATQGDNSLGLASEINTSYTTPKQTLYSSDENNIDFDGGMYRLGAISGQLFWDANQDLRVDGYDFGIWDVEVSLYRAADVVGSKAVADPIATTITDSNGNYEFNNLIPGDYVVLMDNTYFGSFENMPADYQVKDSGHTDVFTVMSGTTRTAVDGAVTRGIGINYIGDYVWEDTDNDGKQDPTENGYNGATVNLIDEDGTIVDTTTTDTDGYYDFFAPSGNYQIEVEVTEDYHFTNNDNTNLETNSDTVATTENIAQTELFDATYNRRDIDSGVRLDGNISGRVYYDTDASGTYNTGDSSTEARTVSLYQTGGILRSDKLIETQEIDLDNDGVFSFTNLTEGAYRLEFSDDVNRFWIENADGELEFDNSKEDNATRDVVLNYGQTITNQDAGYAYGAAISGYIYNDDNYNGIYDLDSELPEANVTVHLIGKDNDELAKTTTDSEGHYGFTNVEPGLSYKVVIDNDSEQYTVTKTMKLNKKLGNDMYDNNNVIETTEVTLSDNELNDVDFDGGIVYKTSLSGYVYEDKNIDSTYNDNDQMLNNIEVTLLDEDGLEVDRTLTDNGYFEFTDIEAGYYQVSYDLEDYNVSPKGETNVQYDNDMNAKYLTGTNNVRPKIENNVDFDAAVYTDEDQAALDEYNQMNLGKTGQTIIAGIIAAIIALVALVLVKKKYNN